MGYASYRVWVSGSPRPAKKKALIFYGIQLFLNFLWPLIFFGL
jgi:tryptophan-rich sensory protein